MSDTQKIIDLTYAKNVLFVRHSVAVAFGIPLDQELTWDFLQDKFCSCTGISMPSRILIRGMPSAVGELGDESLMLRSFLHTLEVAHGIEVRIVLHD